MSEHQLMSEKIDLIALALSKTQSEIENVNKDKTAVNQKFKYKYADLSSCIDAIKKSLRSNGLSISQLGTFDSNSKQILVTLLMHESGQWLKSVFYIQNEESMPGNSLQKLGASLTYMRRYALSAIIGLTQEDDDAQSLSNKNYNKIKYEDDNTPAIASEIRCLLSEGKDKQAYSLCESLSISDKQKLWSMLDSHERDKLKKIKEAA